MIASEILTEVVTVQTTDAFAFPFFEFLFFTPRFYFIFYGKNRAVVNRSSTN